MAQTISENCETNDVLVIFQRDGGQDVCSPVTLLCP